MASEFSKRFKSSMQVSKNKSIFDNLVPIDKTLRSSQIHNDFQSRHLGSTLEYNLKPGKVDLDLKYFPMPNSPLSTKATNRKVKIGKKEHAYPLYASPDPIVKSNSPNPVKEKIDKDIRRILKSVERSEEILLKQIWKKSKKLNQKRNLSKFSICNK